MLYLLLLIKKKKGTIIIKCMAEVCLSGQGGYVATAGTALADELFLEW